MEYGAPDGHGIYGQLTTGPSGDLICHECGAERQFLGRHIREHGLSASEYKERHGLGRGASLAADTLRTTWSERASARVGSPEWMRFAAARDADAARQEALRARMEPPRAQARETWRQNAALASRARPVRVCEVPDCGRKHVADGLCRTHYERRKRTGDVQAHIPVRPRRGGPKPS
jgi:hypothetical protein